jgi:hypothetical protein
MGLATLAISQGLLDICLNEAEVVRAEVLAVLHFRENNINLALSAEGFGATLIENGGAFVGWQSSMRGNCFSRISLS